MSDKQNQDQRNAEHSTGTHANTAAGEGSAQSGPGNPPHGGNAEQLPPEIGGPQGPEPTRYGDWERAGRCSDF